MKRRVDPLIVERVRSSAASISSLLSNLFGDRLQREDLVSRKMAAVEARWVTSIRTGRDGHARYPDSVATPQPATTMDREHRAQAVREHGQEHACRGASAARRLLVCLGRVVEHDSPFASNTPERRLQDEGDRAHPVPAFCHYLTVRITWSTRACRPTANRSRARCE